jgi:hypothetical protein
MFVQVTGAFITGPALYDLKSKLIYLPPTSSPAYATVPSAFKSITSVTETP